MSSMRRVKMRAIQRNQKLKDAIAQLLELGMAAERNVRSSRGVRPNLCGSRSAVR